MAGNKTRNEIKVYLIVGTVILGATVSLMMFGAHAEPSQDLGPLLAGLAVSTFSWRFGVRWKWLTFLLLASFLVVGLLLGPPGLFWMGGYVSGSNLGAAWRLAVTEDRVKSPWVVNGQGVNTAAEARNSARDALHALDGDKHERLVVEHGAARFEAAGSATSTLVCHRNSDAEQEDSWSILSRPEQPSDASVEVPMGSTKGFIPSRFVHPLGPVEAALEGFLRNPGAEALGPEWSTGELAFDLRLSS